MCLIYDAYSRARLTQSKVQRWLKVKLPTAPDAPLSGPLAAAALVLYMETHLQFQLLAGLALQVCSTLEK